MNTYYNWLLILCIISQTNQEININIDFLININHEKKIILNTNLLYSYLYNKVNYKFRLLRDPIVSKYLTYRVIFQWHHVCGAPILNC